MINEKVTLKKSSKYLGKYEKILINQLSKHYTKLGYRVFPHVRFNIAWSKGLSDIDLLVIKNNNLTLIEVKSKQDKISRIYDQINRVRNYVDFIYLATNKNNIKLKDRTIGLIELCDGNIKITKYPIKNSKRKMSWNSLYALKKTCLERLCGNGKSKYKLKSILVEEVLNNINKCDLKNLVKEIVLCKECSEINCPINYLLETNTTEKSSRNLDSFL